MFIDIHAHAYLWPGPRNFSTPQQLLERYRAIGIERAVLLPLVSPEVYLPQSNEEILEIARRWPDQRLWVAASEGGRSISVQCRRAHNVRSWLAGGGIAMMVWN